MKKIILLMIVAFFAAGCSADYGGGALAVEMERGLY
jgi:hypothetical protein